MSTPSSQPPGHQPAGNKAPTPHLIPALAAILVLVGAIFFLDRVTSAQEDQYVYRLAHIQQHQFAVGTVIMQAAIRQPDLLPVFGSSEMLLGASGYRPRNFFSSSPTGFSVIDFSTKGITLLNITQDLAAIGPELRGKKIVVSFTPDNFRVLEVGKDEYAGNFSRMHAYGLAFSPDLSMALKQRMARRMLDYPDTLSKDPILAFALQNLAANTLPNQILYYLTFPTGQLENLGIRMQDHYSVRHFMQMNSSLSRIPPLSQKINWSDLVSEAENQQKIISSNNPYGFENDAWLKHYHDTFEVKQPASGDSEYLNTLAATKEWEDMDMFLQTLNELGAKPLILGRPINGILYTAAGISSRAQQVYYNRIQTLVGRYYIPFLDFRDYTNDRYFNIDISHPSRKGYAITDQTLDAFFHGMIK